MAAEMKTLYLDTVNLLKELGLWDLDAGMKFLPIIQYCMPPPSTRKIMQLLEDLIRCGVDTDWAPLKLSKILLKKIRGKPQIDSGNPASYGSDYPVQNGIHRIANQDWSPEHKACLINDFVTKIFKMTAEEKLLNLQEYYDDVYKLRDVLIYTYANKHGLNYAQIHDKSIDAKRLKVSSINKGKRLVGTKGVKPELNLDNTFWANPPETKFSFATAANDSGHGKKNMVDTHGVNTGENSPEPTPEEQLLNNQQQIARPYFSQPKWSRDNVRSLADMNQLCWSTIFAYWESVLQANKSEIFNLSLLVLLTGIRKKRWLNAIDSQGVALTLDSLDISTVNTISYKVNRAGKVFSKNRVYAKNYVTLQLPDGLKLSKKLIDRGLREEGFVRGFSKKRPGPVPFLNNVARSGHVLFRKNISGETLAFFLSGSIPIEFQSRVAYYQTSNSKINDLFRAGLEEVKKACNEYGQGYRLVNEQLKKINFANTSAANNYNIGSQLAKSKWDFKKFNTSWSKDLPLKEKILGLNQLELYYFWMLEYAYATRAFGDETIHVSGDGFIFHHDKNSAEYIEAKLLKASSIVSEQKTQLDKCRESVLLQAQSQGYSMSQVKSPVPLVHKHFKIKKQVISQPLLSADAVRLAEKYWQMAPVLGRSNALRHQCSTYAHDELGEIHADAWLGHHIDGWYFSSPQSAGCVSVLNDVAVMQEQWLKSLGFHVVRNPLL